jgi:hypothetical protein
MVSTEVVMFFILKWNPRYMPEGLHDILVRTEEEATKRIEQRTPESKVAERWTLIENGDPTGADLAVVSYKDVIRTDEDGGGLPLAWIFKISRQD